MTHDIQAVALTLVADGKGILAADETVPTLTRRFETLGIQSTERSRRTYREMLFTAGAADCISQHMFGRIFADSDTYGAEPPSDAYLERLLAREDVVALIALAGDDVLGGLVAYELEKFESERREL